MKTVGAYAGAICAGALMIAAVVLAALPGPAAGSTGAVTGKLSKSGYAVIALSRSGEARVDRARNGKFKLRPPAKKVTLHLRAPSGAYAGPIVLAKAKKGKRAILGLSAKRKVQLGKVKLERKKGYAKLKKRVAKKLEKHSQLDGKRAAKAKKGVPIGNGRNFGRVRVKKPKGVPGDSDSDGIPDRLDIDDDGDLVLDSIDGSGARGRARAAQADNEIYTEFQLPSDTLDQTANVNAGSSDQQIAEIFTAWGQLGIDTQPGDHELDCGGAPDPANPSGWLDGLSYCTRGGTGRWIQPDLPVVPNDAEPFPECCDADGDGFGSLLSEPMFLRTATTASQIGSGDILVHRITDGGVEREVPTVLQFVFATVPALVSYDDGQGNSAVIDYPVSRGPTVFDPGTPENPFPVKAGPSGDVVVKFTYWRPQRRPISPETGDWIDLGGLTYTAHPGTPTLSTGYCPQSSFSTTDPDLTLPLPDFRGGGLGGLRDTAADEPSSRSNKFSFTLNLTECLSSALETADGGPVPADPISLEPGETRRLGLAANAEGNGGGLASQGFFFKRVP